MSQIRRKEQGLGRESQYSLEKLRIFGKYFGGWFPGAHSTEPGTGAPVQAGIAYAPGARNQGEIAAGAKIGGMVIAAEIGRWLESTSETGVK